LSNERKLLAAILKDRDAYDSCRDHNLEDTLTEHGKVLYSACVSYYDRDEGARHIDPELLSQQLSTTLTNPKHRTFFKELVDDLAKVEVSPANILAVVFGQYREAAGGRLASALASGRKAGEVENLIADYQKWAGAESAGGLAENHETTLVAPSVQAVVDDRKGTRIAIMPRALNDAIRGGALPGHHVVVFARPETGKTTFVLNATAGFLKQGKTVLYVGNEDPAEDIICRLVGRMTGMRIEEVEANAETADGRARACGYDNFIYAGLAPGTLRELESLVDDYEPDVLIVDQVRNIAIGGADGGYTVKLEAAASGVRALAKKYGIVAISVTQAGDSASDKSILDMGDVDFSNTGIPATADLMIGIGASKEDVMANRLVLSLCKNKIGGKHSIIPVIVDYSLGKLISQK
jgi:archaellum biogenesis ATPase FlaH